ncbi:MULTISPECIES: redoxin domain-containing protein [Streptomyces]|uniref:redoxin domain-containing protein n=1 Tax=Streptomyces TaxID=1883 RepID=UPI001F412513|nr:MULTISPECIES: redoxin domain-containing protein [Streptomyces]
MFTDRGGPIRRPAPDFTRRIISSVRHPGHASGRTPGTAPRRQGGRLSSRCGSPADRVQCGGHRLLQRPGVGARLVAVSPLIPDESLSLAEKHDLAFDLPDDLAAVYDRLGFDLQRVNDGHPRTLPLPATYVIDRSGTIRWAFVDTDYTTRAEPADIITALDALD